MTPEQAYAYLDEHSEVHIEPGLDCMRSAMELLAEPQDGYAVIHVAGTNGKSSVARMAAALLAAFGVRAGLYTSPHLVDFAERIEIGGTRLKPRLFADQIAYLRPILEETAARCGRHPTYFEIATTLAFATFLDAVVDAAVIETGLGGAFDATNVVHAAVAVLTNVSIDHTAFLGSELVGIAGEKAGIIKEGSTVVTAIEEPELLDIIEARSHEVGAEALWRLGREIRLTRCENAFGGIAIDLATPGGAYVDLQLPLLGRHQGKNAALAIAAAEALIGAGCALDADMVQSGLDNVESPGRLELIDHRPLLVLDGAHNPAGARVLRVGLAETFTYERLIAVVGILGDKDATGMLQELAAATDMLVATAPPSERALDPDELASLAHRLGIDAEVERDPSAALERARELATPEDLVLVAGSLYLVGAVRDSVLAAR